MSISIFYVDYLSLIFGLLISFQGFMSIARLYKKSNIQSFIQMIGYLICSIIVLCSKNIFLIGLVWGISGILLVFLFKKYIKNFNVLIQYFLAAYFFIVLSLSMLFYVSQKILFFEALTCKISEDITCLIGFCICLAIAISGGIWPFEQWFLCVNKALPQELQVFLHCIYINMHFYFLIRYAPLLYTCPVFLRAIYIIGCITITIASLRQSIQISNNQNIIYATIANTGCILVLFSLGIKTLLAFLVWNTIFRTFLLLHDQQNCLPETIIRLPSINQIAKIDRFFSTFFPYVLSFCMICILPFPIGCFLAFFMFFVCMASTQYLVIKDLYKYPPLYRGSVRKMNKTYKELIVSNVLILIFFAYMFHLIMIPAPFSMQSILLHEIWIYYLGSSLFIVSLFIFFIIIKKHIPSSSIEETYNRITTNEKSLIHPPLLIEQGTRIKILSTDKEIFLYGFYRIYLYLQQTYINSLVLSVVIGPYLTIYMFVQAFFPHWTESMKEKIYKKII